MITGSVLSDMIFFPYARVFVSLRKDRACPRSVSAARWGHRAPLLGHPLRGQPSAGGYLPFCRSAGDTKKTSTRISVEAVGIVLLETRVEANAIAFPLQVLSNSKLPTFFVTTALQRKLICRSALHHDGESPSLRIAYDCGGALPAYMPVSGLALFLSFRFGLRHRTAPSKVISVS